MSHLVVFPSSRLESVVAERRLVPVGGRPTLVSDAARWRSRKSATGNSGVRGAATFGVMTLGLTTLGVLELIHRASFR
jgi:hypothetical protein